MQTSFVASAALGIAMLGAVQSIGAQSPRAQPRTVVVASNVPWTTTGIRVKTGESIRFEATGEIRLSFDGADAATPAGAPKRFAEKAPIPAVLVGTLIGRINNGKPFSIGSASTALPMPAGGTLFLGVNDDHVPDNSGNYVVNVWAP